GGDVGFLGDRYAQVAVVGREAVAAAVLDGPVVRHVAVDRGRFRVGGLDLHERDVAVHRLRRDVARDLARLDRLVHAAQVDTAACLLECHVPLHRLEGDVAGAARDLHGALDRLGRDLPLASIDRDVGVDARQGERHRGGDRDLVVHDLGRPAPALRFHAYQLVGRVDRDAVATRVAGG